jgi:hypothetical protein
MSTDTVNAASGKGLVGAPSYDPESRRAAAHFASRTLIGEAPRAWPSLDAPVLEQAARVAKQNKLLRPFMAGLAASDAPPPAGSLDALETYRRRTIMRNGSGLRTLHKVAPVLAAAGIRFAVFKGPLQQLLLTGDSFDRPASDVDLLVANRDFDRVVGLLRGLGYVLPSECDSQWWRTYLGEQHLFPKDPSLATIDLHHRTQQPGCPSPRRPQALLESLQAVKVGELSIPTLNPASMALLSAISIVKALIHREAAGAHVLDFARMMQSASPQDRQAIGRAAAAQGLARAHDLALQAVDAFCGLRSAGRRPAIVDEATLLAMLLTPDDPAIDWPKRRRLLWYLTDGESLPGRAAHYLKEVGWAGAAELSRLAHEAGRMGRAKAEAAAGQPTVAPGA